MKLSLLKKLERRAEARRGFLEIVYIEIIDNEPVFYLNNEHPPGREPRNEDGTIKRTLFPVRELAALAGKIASRGGKLWIFDLVTGETMIYPGKPDLESVPGPARDYYDKYSMWYLREKIEIPPAVF